MRVLRAQRPAIRDGSVWQSWPARYEPAGCRESACSPDCDGDGLLNFFDSLCFQNEFLAGCP